MSCSAASRKQWNSQRIKYGFDKMQTFLALAQTILQRRKARSGRSLEIHARAIFKEEGLREDRHFSYQVVTPQGRRPDFVFPSEAAYSGSDIPRRSDPHAGRQDDLQETAGGRCLNESDLTSPADAPAYRSGVVCRKPSIERWPSPGSSSLFLRL